MRLQNFILEYDQNSSLNMLYGGMPGGGGYGSATEFEIGLQRYCEAAHCILGSIHKSFYSDFEHFYIEREHIHEEIGIMEKVAKEYSRDLYLDRVETGIIDNNKYSLKTLENLKRNGPELKKLAERMKSKIGNVREDVKNVAELAYDCIIYVADYSTPIHDILKNPFQDMRCDRLTKKLRDAIQKLKFGG